ncbi:MAG TPA: hypothetical protein VM324_06760 [Egibacteraceae bacterium]|jgi:hypothetical protein|nr:hypothetical protein [Egibacteraceae bacterium]
MPRAELHYALALDREIYEASRIDPSLLDPVVRVEDGLPGMARPIAVLRDYQGPQGTYIEQFVLRDRRGRERASSPPRRIELEGQMAQDRFVSTLRDVVIENPDEHTLTFSVDGREVGSIPVFIEASSGGDLRLAAEETFKKAVKKGTILWLTVPQPDGSHHEQPVWFVFDGGKVYVVSGPTEQNVPHLADADEVEITARSKDVRSRVSRVPAAVRVIAPEDPTYMRIVETALPKRLNLTDPNEAADRWKANCALVELTPRFRDEEERAPAARAPAAAAAAPAAAPVAKEAAPAGGGQAEQKDAHIEPEIDKEVFDRLIAEGKSERVARAKAKAAFVRKEKQRIGTGGSTPS